MSHARIRARRRSIALLLSGALFSTLLTAEAAAQDRPEFSTEVELPEGDAPEQREGTAEGPGQTAAGRNTQQPRTLRSQYPQGRSSRPVTVNRAQVVQSPPAPLVGFDQATSRELPAARSERERTFANADGSETTQVSEGPVNYQRPDGSWSPIDTRLAPLPAGGWVNSTNLVQTTLAPRAGATDLVSVRLPGGHQLGYGVSGGDAVPGQANGSTVTYPGVRPGADLRLDITPGGVKETLVLHGKNAPTSWDFPLRLKGLTARLAGNDVVLLDSGGTERARLPRGFMEDSARPTPSAEGAISHGVQYGLAGSGDQQVLRLTLDTGWLADPARRFPVLVDPPITTGERTSSGLVLQRSTKTGATDRLPAGDVFRVGNSREWTSVSLLPFSSSKNGLLEERLRHHRVSRVDLFLANNASWSCRPRPVQVYGITGAWDLNSAAWPGPATGEKLGEKSFAHGHTNCPEAGEAVNLGDKGNAWVQSWLDGTRPNRGLLLRTPTEDPYEHKLFRGYNKTAPQLIITHTPYNAKYEILDGGRPNPPVTKSSDGSIKVKVTNTGPNPWPKDRTKLAAKVFNGNALVTKYTSATLPRDLAHGESETLTASIHQLKPGVYDLDLGMFDDKVEYFDSRGVPPVRLRLEVVEHPPLITNKYPPNGFQLSHLTPQLWADVVDLDGDPTNKLEYRFVVCPRSEGNAPPAGDPKDCFDSGWTKSLTWTVPAGKLAWSRTYSWRVDTRNGTTVIPDANPGVLLATVPQPEITSRLSASPYSGGPSEFDPQVGNYFTSAIDASLAGVGPDLTLARTYNSLDPRRDLAFGAGWVTRYDMRLAAETDGSGNVLVVYPDGQQVRFGRNPEGVQPVYAPPPGRFATLTREGEGWKLLDKGATAYVFDGTGRLLRTTDSAGRSAELSYDPAGRLKQARNTTSGRSLHFGWTGDHVTTVSTDQINGKPLTWTYSYEAERLTKVCPTRGPCTQYQYRPTSHYRSLVSDARPESYWRLGENDGETARSQVQVNTGTDNATYRGTTLGTAGALPGTEETAVTFDGTASHVALPDNIVRKSRDVTVELWFRTAKAGVLFSYQRQALDSTDAQRAKFTPALYVGRDGRLFGQFWDGKVDPIRTAGPVNDDHWHHVVLSAAATSQTLYLDGKAIGSHSVAAGNGPIDHADQAKAYLGAGFLEGFWPQQLADKRGFFTGSIDEVAVYHRPLDAAAVAAHHAAGRAEAQVLNRVLLPSGRTGAEVEYDTAGDRVSAYTDRRGGRWELGQPVVSGGETQLVRSSTVKHPDGWVHQYDYDALAGRIVRYQFRGDGEKVPATTRTYGYDADGFTATVTDENGDTVTTVNDDQGNPVRKTTCRARNDCQSAHFSYFSGPEGDPRNGRQTVSRDARSSSATDDRYATRYEYHSSGELAKQTMPDGSTVEHAYTSGTEPASGGGTTPPGLLKSTKDAANRSTQYTYLASGDLAQITDSAGLVTRFGYDGLGRRTSQTVVSDSFPAGVTTRFDFDELNRQFQVTEPGTTNPVTGVTHTRRTTQTFDEDSNPKTVTVSDLTGGDQPRQSVSEYGGHGELVKTTDPAGGVSEYGYDPIGNPAWTVDPAGHRTEYTYTPWNKLESERVLGWWREPDEAPEGAATDPVTTHRYEYDAAGRMRTHTDAAGRQVVYDYYGDGLSRSVTAKNVVGADGTRRDVVIEASEYDAAGNVVKHTTGGGTSTAYEIDAAGRTRASTQAPGTLDRRTVYDFDPNGYVRTVTQSGRPSNTAATGPVAPVVTGVVDYTYDAMGNQLTQTVHHGDQRQTTSWQRDARGLLVAETDPRGNAAGADREAYTTRYRHDELGRQIQVTEPAVSAESAGQAAATVRPQTTTGYDTFDSATHSRDALGHTSVTQHDILGRPVVNQAPAYRPPGSSPDAPPIVPTTRAVYDKAGNLTETVDPRGASTRYVFDQFDRPLRRLDPPVPADTPGLEHSVQLDGESGRRPVWTTEYTGVGEVRATLAPDGSRTQATYDELGRKVSDTLTERKPVQAELTSWYGWDDANNLRWTKSPTGLVTNYEYDALGQQTKATTPAGVTVSRGYDGSGQLVRAVDGLGRAATSEYDATGNLVRTVDLSPAGKALRERSYGYDLNGNRTSQTDARKVTGTARYDAADQLVEQVRPVRDGQSIRTSFGYDAAGHRTRSTNGRGHATLYTYNSLGLPESVVEPATSTHPNAPDRTWSAVYNAAGQAERLTAPGGITRTRVFDAYGRTTHEAGAGASITTEARTFGYDAVGRLVNATVGAAGTNSFGYNDRGQLLATEGPSGRSAFGYDGDGRMAVRNDAAGSTSYRYDKGRLDTVVDGLTGAERRFGYNAAGQVRSVGYSTGKVRRFDYDDLGRLTGDTLLVGPGVGTGAAGGRAVASIAYGYDLNDRLTSKKSTGLAGPADNTYGYDAAGRLTSWTATGKTVSYGWDDADNRVSVGEIPSTYDERNRLLTDGSNAYTYTARGTLATRKPTAADAGAAGPANFSFDAFDQLIHSGATSYGYDGLGRLASRDRKPLAYSGAGDELAADGTDVYARDPDGDLISVAVAGADGKPTGARAAWTDAHGDLVGAFDATGEAASVNDSVSYDPFGQTGPATGTRYTAGFQGQFTDPESGSVNMGSRWYSSTTGSFLSRDDLPMDAPGFMQAANRYSYAAGDPLNNVDLDGHWPSWVSSAGSWLAGKARSVAHAVVRGVKAVGRAVVSAVRAAVRYVSKAASWVWNKAKSAAKWAWSKAKGAARWVANKAKAASRWAAQKAKAAAAWAAKHNPLPVLKAALKPLMSSIKSVARAMANLPALVLQQVVNVVKDAASFTLEVTKALAQQGAELVTQVSKAASAAADWAVEHRGEIGSFLVGAAVGLGCGAAIGWTGVGAIACGALAGAATGAFDHWMSGKDQSLSGYLGAAAKGGAFGALGGALGNVGGALISRGVNALKGRLGPAAGKVLDKVDDVVGKTCPIRRRDPNSFTPATQVVMADGSRRAIGDVRVGDKVLATNLATGTTEARAVTAVITGAGLKHLVDVTVDTDGAKGRKRATVTATAGHPFWVRGKGWTEAKNLKAGDQLRTTNGQNLRATAVHAYDRETTVKNLTVDVEHTYYVAVDSFAVLVHNARPPRQRPDPTAEGPHTTFMRHGSTNQIKKYAEWGPNDNPHDPKPFKLVKRFDLEGPAHVNPDGEIVETPHINDSDGTARKPEAWEKPNGCE